MLRLKIDKKDIKQGNNNLLIINGSGDSINTVTIADDIINIGISYNVMSTDGTVHFENDIYTDTVEVTKTDKCTFSFYKLDNLYLNITSITTLENTDYSKLEGNYLLFNSSDEHTFNLQYNYNNLAYERLCVGDYVSDNGLLRKITEIKNSKYSYSSEIYNVRDIKLYVTCSEKLATHCIENEIDDYDRVNNILTLYNFIAPLVVNTYTVDSTRLLWDYSEYSEDLIELLKSECTNCLFSYDNNYYWYYDSDKKCYRLYNSTVMYCEFLNFNIAIPIIENDSYTLTKNEYNDLVISDKKKEMITDIIDYEKQIFEPVFKVSDGKGGYSFIDVKQIEFNLHFRKRTIETDSSGNITSWKLDKNAKWNVYPLSITSDSTKVIKALDAKVINSDITIRTPEQSDPLYYLGFDDNDVYYRANKIKKSFIRLSFYDSRDRGNNSLLFYSTVFMDSEDLYGKYIKSVLLDRNAEKIPYTKFDRNVENDDINYGLCSTFNCYCRDNTSGRSDGFYTYFYPDIVNGIEETSVYLKVEFNHAKFGETVVLSMPTKDGEILTPDDDNFPTTYADFDFNDVTLTDSSGNTITGTNASFKTNTEAMYKDIYIEIKIRYDNDLKRYIWYLPQECEMNEQKKLIFNLFEPIVN